MSDVTKFMKSEGFTFSPVISDYPTRGYTKKTFTYGNSSGMVIANFSTNNRTGKTKVSVALHTGKGWTQNIYLTPANEYFNTERQKNIIERRIARMVSKLW